MADWIPLESNPDVINKYARTLGLEKGHFCDVFGLDDDLLNFVEGKCLAFILLFPITQKYEEYRAKEDETLPTDYDKDSIYFMKQTVGNACGTIGIIHAIANNRTSLMIKPNSALHNFIAGSQGKDPAEAAQIFADDESIRGAHESAGNEGQTSAPGQNEIVNLHFVAITQIGDKMFELDGRKSAPVCHGERDQSRTFKQSAAAICKKFMQRDPEENRFSMLALCIDEN